MPEVDPALDVGRDETVTATERRVGIAVFFVTGHGVVVLGPGRRVTDDDDHAVGLDRDPVGAVDAAEEVGRDGAGIAEVRVGRAVGEEALHAEVLTRAAPDDADHDDLVVGLHRDVGGAVEEARRRGRS